MESQLPNQPPVPTGPVSPLQQPAYQSPQPPPQPAVEPAKSMSDKQNEAEEVAWVDKTKAVIASTNGDPHARHQVLNELRAQYLRERFGKDIGG